MKTFKIISKLYVSTPVPISPTQSVVLPKKGQSITIQMDEIPQSLKAYQSKKLIIIEEI